MTSTAAKPATAGTTTAPDTFDSLDPRDGSVVATHPRHTAEQVEAVVARARALATGEPVILKALATRAPSPRSTGARARPKASALAPKM